MVASSSISMVSRSSYGATLRGHYMVDVSPEDAERYLPPARLRTSTRPGLAHRLGRKRRAVRRRRNLRRLLPFVSSDVLAWNDDYWQRVHSYLVKAANHGITVFLYPIDGWTIGNSFVPASISTCHEYGMRLAKLLAALPNIVWMTGGDYFPATEDGRR